MKLVRFARLFVLVLPVPAFSAALSLGFRRNRHRGAERPNRDAVRADGRLFILRRAAGYRVGKDGSLVATPFLTIQEASINSSG